MQRELSKTRAAFYSGLNRRKIRDREGLFLAEGTKCVADTFGHFGLEALIALPEWIETHPALAAEAGDALLVASPALMRKVSVMVSAPDVVAVYSIPPGVRPQCAPVFDGGLVVVLDGVQDPGNLGTIMRAAHWFGVRDILASPDTVDIFNPKAVQATMGAIASVRISYFPLPAAFDANPQQRVAALMLEGKDIFSTKLPVDAFMVLGSEGHGVSGQVRERIDLPLTIPPFDPCNHPESLNVGVAGAIALSRFRF